MRELHTLEFTEYIEKNDAKKSFTTGHFTVDLLWEFVFIVRPLQSILRASSVYWYSKRSKKDSSTHHFFNVFIFLGEVFLFENSLKCFREVFLKYRNVSIIDDGNRLSSTFPFTAIKEIIDQNLSYVWRYNFFLGNSSNKQSNNLRKI